MKIGCGFGIDWHELVGYGLRTDVCCVFFFCWRTAMSDGVKRGELCSYLQYEYQ